ncbi:MAG: FAD:protein FMN transferase [Prevotellaceae bacterium]|jgi:thiamine biosynthesis lipoprotein|nr:FAD:protein FMN transferase [Prevotellaceae bacterium]
MKHAHYLIALWIVAGSCSQLPSYTTITGFTMGTTYQITCRHNNIPPDSLLAGIEATLAHIDRSLSVYNDQSIISKVNRNEPVAIDSFFRIVFTRSYEIYTATNGAFDIAASPLFNAWGFGFTQRETVTPTIIDSLQQFCGMQRVRIHGDRLIKDDPRVTLNANAIAKGFGVDAVATFLEQSDIRHYIVEIGGEIRSKGQNRYGKPWRVGIDKPVEGAIFPGESLQAILQLSDKALATSGNYRRYYEENGTKYAHTINPATGYPVSHTLLSATIIASDCMTADAYATAMMVIGLDSAKQFLNTHPELGAFLIYNDRDTFRSFHTNNIREMINE